MRSLKLKENFKMFTLVFALMFVFIVKVNASDLSSTITVSDGLGGLTTFTKSYDSINNINNLKVVLTVDETVIDTILAQKPGVGGNLSYFYMGINPNIGITSMYKQNYYYAVDTTKTVDEIKEELKESITDSDLSSNGVVWNIGLMIQYYDTTSNSWKLSNTPGDGVTSISGDLVSKLGLTDSSELEYGVNFRFAMYENYNWYYVWTDINPNNSSGSLGLEEYIKVSYEIAFPVTSSNDEESVYHITLKDAIENGHNNIIINSNIELTEDITIPEGTKVTIAEGKTVTLNGAKIINKGIINNNGTITDGQGNYYTVITESENGIVVADKNLVLSGEEIVLTTTANNGYNLKSIKVIDLTNNNEITLEDGKFVMPRGNVKVIANFEKIEVPNTVDNIMVFVILAIISSIASIFAINKLRKNA